MTIGRSKHCDICIPSHFVSRHELHDGDVVSLGGHLDLLFVEADR